MRLLLVGAYGANYTGDTGGNWYSNSVVFFRQDTSNEIDLMNNGDCATERNTITGWLSDGTKQHIKLVIKEDTATKTGQ